MKLIQMALGAGLRIALGASLIVSAGAAARAADIPPPMLDIARQCDVNSRHNVTAMSECVVAESEARSQLLQNWTKYSDASAERCVKEGRKAKRLPYTAMAKCMSVGTATATSAPAPK